MFRFELEMDDGIELEEEEGRLVVIILLYSGVMISLTLNLSNFLVWPSLKRLFDDSRQQNEEACRSFQR